jgi:hypothetical protein
VAKAIVSTSAAVTAQRIESPSRPHHIPLRYYQFLNGGVELLQQEGEKDTQHTQSSNSILLLQMSAASSLARSPHLLGVHRQAIETTLIFRAQSSLAMLLLDSDVALSAQAVRQEKLCPFDSTRLSEKLADKPKRPKQ